jgi:hypothetical protein
VTCQALFQQDRRRGQRLTTPGLLADALFEVIPAPLAPPPAPPPAPRADSFASPGLDHRPDGATDYPRSPYPDTAGWPAAGRPRPPASRPPRRPVSRAVIAVIALLVVAAIATGVYSLTRSGGGSAASPGNSGGNSASPSEKVTTLQPVQAGGFDALGLASDPGNENNDEAPAAIDSNPQTAWHTQFYLGSAAFGNLKKGTGLLLDMGKPVSLSSAQITFGPTAGANVAIEVGNNPSVTPAGLASFTRVAKQKDVGAGTQTFKTKSSPKGRYVLIWFTKLPPKPSSSNTFEAFIYNIVIRGTG